MNKLIVALSVVLTALSASAADVVVNEQTFHLPDGFTLELVAAPPLVDRPVTADFDEQGRLYVTDSSGSNEPLIEQVKNPTHRVLRLEDTDGDGVFDSRTVFADKVMFPEGTMWYDGSLYVSAPPSIWKFTDTDDDGVADKREEWVQPGTLTGCGNDLHGPYLGPDGWIYWCKGAFAEQTYDRPGRDPWTTTASHIFRCRADAPRDPETGAVKSSAIEPVMTGGMDNPVDVVFTPGGERLFTTTFLVHPGGGMRDGLIHAIYGGIYGKNRVSSLAGHPRTGELMPVLRHFGAGAPCGFTRVRSEALGDGFRNNLFASLFNMRKITRHVLTPEGASFTTAPNDVEDFLVGDDLDFHPTDILEDADGSLLVCDTGGWYKLCCPSSQLEKPDMLGAIYRIRRTGAPSVNAPRGEDIAWEDASVEQLVGLLGDPRHAVREQATQRIAKIGDGAVPLLDAARKQSEGADVRRRIVWALCRIDSPAAREAGRAALDDPDEIVRQAAIHAVSVWRDQGAIVTLLKILKNQTPANQRVAAEALGRLGDSQAVAALLEVAGQPHDRALEHSLTYALIEIADAEATAAGLASENPYTRRAALFALDQMRTAKQGGSLLKAADVVPLLSAEDATLRTAADWLVDRHPDWAESMVGYFRKQLSLIAATTTDEARLELEDRLARFASQPPATALLAESLDSRNLSAAARLLVVRVMSRSALKTMPTGWVVPLVNQLEGAKSNVQRETVEVFRRLPLAADTGDEVTNKVREILGRLGRDSAGEAEHRLAALSTIPGGLENVDDALLKLLASHLDNEQPVGTRSLAIEVIGKAKLNADQLVEIAGVMGTVSSLDMDPLLEAISNRSQDENVGVALMAAIEASPARSALRIENIETRIKDFPPKVHERAEQLYEALRRDTAEQRTRLETLLTSMPSGDVRRGQLVFKSSKASCSACHEIGYLGGDVGPDLSHIAKIRKKRDLLEAIVFPSASLVRSYEPVVIVTDAGKTYNGIIHGETETDIVLVTGPNQQVRIAKDEIEETLPSNVSVMPTGLDKQLSEQELSDLVEFLMSRT